MAHASARSRPFDRALSLRAPIASEEERALFQRRLALTLGVVFALAFVFWAIQLATLGVVHPDKLVHLFVDPVAVVQLATTFSALVGWLVLRGGHRSVRLLDVADVVTSLGLAFGWAAMTAVRHERPEANMHLVSLLAMTYTMFARAALVPSTPARTALLATIGVLPLLPAAYVANVRAGVSTADALDSVIYSAIWGVIGAANVTVVSWVVYGLRMEVRKAMRLGQYVLDDKIGEGGMGEVYRAHHAMLRRATAIKLLTGTTGHATARFEREVQITARLTHPNTIAIFDYGRTPDGVFYYAMEYLDGITVEELVERHGPQSPSRVVHLLLQVCGALEEAHGAGLVHRDIKPANLMLTQRGGFPDVVKVLDFGLVKEAANPDPALSTVESILGTPHYMSPEAIVEPSSMDARADLYAVGATAFFLLTGERVFEGASLVEICSKHLHQEPDAPSRRRPGVPEALDAVVLACLAKEREGRPASAEALGELLRALPIPAWSRADAHAWWASHGGERAAHGAPHDPSRVLGTTVAVALEDRA